MKRRGPLVGSGPRSDTSVRVAGERSHTRSEASSASPPSPLSASTDANAPVRIIVEPTVSGRKWSARYDDRVLCVSAWPFVKSARRLLAEGHSANAVIEMWRPDAEAWSLRGKIGAVAATVIDGEKGPPCAKNGPPVSDYERRASQSGSDLRWPMGRFWRAR